MIQTLHSGSLDLYISAYRSTPATSNRLYPGHCVPHPSVSAYRGFSHPSERKKAELLKILTELECHGNSPCLQKLPLSLESILGDELQVWKGVTLEDMNDSKMTEKPEQRESLNRYLQILLDPSLASSDPCTESTNVARIRSEARVC